LRRPHLLCVQQTPESFAPLVEGASEAGLRVGWLEMGEVEPPARLGAAAATGVMRAVAVGGQRTVAVKPVRGDTVLRDLLREHFLGCVLVLVTGEVDAPRLEAEGGGWIVQRVAGKPLRFATGELVRALSKAHPFV
jgi:hypothetical protein